MRLILLLTLFCVSAFAGSVMIRGPIGERVSSAALTQPSLIRAVTNTGSGASFTITSFDCTGGNFIVIAIAWGSSLTRSVSSLTVNGVAATNIYTTNYNSTTTGKVLLYGLVNPTTGNIVLTLNNSVNSATIIPMLFNNVGGVSASSGDFTTSARTSTSDSLTTVATDLVVDAEAYNGSTAFPTVAAGQTLVAQTGAGSAASGNCSASTKPGSAGSTTMTWNSASQTLAWVGVVLNGL